jgi:hypothetical protein
VGIFVDIPLEASHRQAREVWAQPTGRKKLPHTSSSDNSGKNRRKSPLKGVQQKGIGVGSAPVLCRVSSPSRHLAVTSQLMMARQKPLTAPVMAPTAVHLDQTRQYAMGMTADPMSTPMSRYTYLQPQGPTKHFST